MTRVGRIIVAVSLMAGLLPGSVSTQATKAGVVTTLDGAEDVLRHGSVVAGNPQMHQWLLDLLRNT